MNFNTYGAHYGKFHKCSVSLVRHNILVFDLGHSPYETWTVSRMYPAERVSIDCDKPLLAALKAFFKTDVPASVVCNGKYMWTACLGNERVVFPVGREVAAKRPSVQLYATPFFVGSADVVSRYLQGAIRPSYENVFFYKNTVMYLDDQDLPYPGGCYFDRCEPTPYHRICFLSNEPVDLVVDLAIEWRARRDVRTVPYMTREVTARPKFLDLRPVSDSGFSEANVLSTGMIRKTLSARKPELLVQDVLASYYENQARRRQLDATTSRVGLFLEHPFLLAFEGARHSDPSSASGESYSFGRRFVALSVNGNHPSRVVHACRPYDRYVEYGHVPATLWTPVSYVPETLRLEEGVRKVVVDSVVVGVAYREGFFCLGQPLLEGAPLVGSPASTLNADRLLSTADGVDFAGDPRIRVLETYRYDDDLSLRRVALQGLDAWCVARAVDTHPRMTKSVRLPGLVSQWIEFFVQAKGAGGSEVADVDASLVRLALMLCKHRLCFRLHVAEKKRNAVVLTDDSVTFHLHERVVQFINDIRLAKRDDDDDESGTEGSSKCAIS